IWASAPARLASRFSAPNTPTCFLTRSGRQTGGQALSPDGWVYVSEEGYDRGFWRSRVRADASCGSEDVERLYFQRWGGPSQVAVSPDGKLVAFASTHLQEFERSFSDIYLWDVERESSEQLDSGLRAREPAFAGPYLFY